MNRERLPWITNPQKPRQRHWHRAVPPRREVLRDREMAYLQRVTGGDMALIVADLAWWAVVKAVHGGTRLAHRISSRVKAKKMAKKMAEAGLPTPEELSQRWHRTRRKTIPEALMLGALLIQVTGTLDDTRVKDEKGRVIHRNGGLKQWLAQYCPDIPYCTACRYRKLAIRLLQFLDADGTGEGSVLLDGASMELLLPQRPFPAGLTPAERRELSKVREVVEQLLTFYPSQRALRSALTRELLVRQAV